RPPAAAPPAGLRVVGRGQDRAPGTTAARPAGPPIVVARDAFPQPPPDSRPTGAASPGNLAGRGGAPGTAGSAEPAATATHRPGGAPDPSDLDELPRRPIGPVGPPLRAELRHRRERTRPLPDRPPLMNLPLP